MAVQYIKEKPSRTSTIDKGVRSGQRTFQVVAEPGDKEDTILAYTALPQVGSPHDALQMWCVKQSAKQQGNPKEWLATFDYSSEDQLSEDPRNDPAEIDWDGEIYTEPVFKDRDGNAIVNSAGDYFIDPSPSREKTHAIARIKKNFGVLPSWWITHRDATNNAPITIDGIPVGQGLARVYRPTASKEMERNGIKYREVTIEIHIHKNGWKLEPLDAGFRKIENGARVQITDANGDEPTTPVPLDGEGDVLSDPTPEDAVFLEFEVDDEIDFTVFPGVN